MAQPSEAAVSAPVSSETDAVAALQEFLDNEEQDETPAAPAVEGDEADEGDEPEADELEEDDEDEPGAPAIDPPASLTAEEKADWAQLPPEAQQKIVAIEARRTSEVQQGLEKARSAQREAESAAAHRVAQAQKLFAEQQATLAQRYMPQEPNPQHYPDWQSYSAAEAQYKTQVAQHQQLMQQLGGLHEEASKEQERLDAETLQSQFKAVKDDLPELADKAQWSGLLDKLTPLALDLGYPEELLADATPVDIRAIKRASAWKEKADKWDALQSRKMATVRSGKTAKPNAAQPLGSGKARASAKASQRLKQTGSLEDAAAAIAHLID